MSKSESLKYRVTSNDKAKISNVSKRDQIHGDCHTKPRLLVETILTYEVLFLRVLTYEV
jgi:hypothetical protein